MGKRTLTAIVEKDGSTQVAACPELRVASQGRSVDDAVWNLREAVELLLEAADPAEVQRRRAREPAVTQIELQTE